MIEGRNGILSRIHVLVELIRQERPSFWEPPLGQKAYMDPCSLKLCSWGFCSTLKFGDRPPRQGREAGQHCQAPESGLKTHLRFHWSLHKKPGRFHPVQKLTASKLRDGSQKLKVLWDATMRAPAILLWPSVYRRRARALDHGTIFNGRS